MLSYHTVQYLCLKQVCPLYSCCLTQPPILPLLVVLSPQHCSVFPHLWRCCAATWITSHLLDTSHSSPSRVVIGLSWEVGAREEGEKERKEQKSTHRARRQGKDLIVEPYGEIIFPGKLSSWQFVRKHELRPWLVPGVKLLPKLRNFGTWMLPAICMYLSVACHFCRHQHLITVISRL